MLCFNSDYMETAHPKILEKLVQINFDKNTSYGFDKYTESAKEKIRKECDCPDALVYFLIGGTQTNKVAIDAITENYEAVICASTGHIATHETGAIESCGHKVITLDGENGKLLPETLVKYMKTFYADENHDHSAQPGLVYISFPTEYGTIYRNLSSKACVQSVTSIRSVSMLTVQGLVTDLCLPNVISLFLTWHSLRMRFTSAEPRSVR